MWVNLGSDIWVQAKYVECVRYEDGFVRLLLNSGQEITVLGTTVKEVINRLTWSG